MQHIYNGITPFVPVSAYIAPGAQLIGDVTLGEDVSIWFNSVLRGDLAAIRIGRNSNIQDGCICHVNTNQPLIVDEGVSVGHGAIIHGCWVQKGSLIGMGAILLNGVEIGEYSLIGAGSVVTENTKIPPYTLSLGTPAKVVRELNEADLSRMKLTMENYILKGLEYRQQGVVANHEI